MTTCFLGVKLDVIREETFLPMQQFLGGDVELLCLAGAHGDLPTLGWKCISQYSRFYLRIFLLALIECYLFAVWPGLGGAVRGLFNLQGNFISYISCNHAL